MARRIDPGLTYMGLDEIENTARMEEMGVKVADQLLHRHDPDATIGRIANRVVNLLSWLKPAIREQVLDEAREGVRELNNAE